MGYQQTQYDPDYESPDFPPPTPRKRRWYLINYALMLSVPAVVFTGLIGQRWFWLVLIWGGAAVSATFGVIMNPNMSLFKEDDPKRFWQSYAILLCGSVAATYFILKADFLK